MIKQSTVSRWYECYFQTAREASYLTILIALLCLGVAIWALFSGLDEAQRVLQKASNHSDTSLVLAHLTGTRLLVLVNLILAGRVISLWRSGRGSYLLGLLMLVSAVLVVWQIATWSDEVLTALILEQKTQGVMTGRPPGFVFGTSPGTVLALVITLFLNLACEFSIFLVSLYRHKFKAGSWDKVQPN